MNHNMCIVHFYHLIKYVRIEKRIRRRRREGEKKGRMRREEEEEKKRGEGE